jgi:hypothetical protein
MRNAILVISWDPSCEENDRSHTLFLDKGMSIFEITLSNFCSNDVKAMEIPCIKCNEPLLALLGVETLSMFA